MKKYFIKAKDAVLIWYANYLIKRAKKAEKQTPSMAFFLYYFSVLSFATFLFCSDFVFFFVSPKFLTIFMDLGRFTFYLSQNSSLSLLTRFPLCASSVPFLFSSFSLFKCVCFCFNCFLCCITPFLSPFVFFLINFMSPHCSRLLMCSFSSTDGSLSFFYHFSCSNVFVFV